MKLMNKKKIYINIIKLYNNPIIILNTLYYGVELLCMTVCVIIILIGIIKSLRLIKIIYNFRYKKYYKKDDETIKNNAILTTRINIAESINLGLTFILAADIIKMIRIPNYYQLGKVTILVGLREFVTHFVDKEIILLKSGKLI